MSFQEIKKTNKKPGTYLDLLKKPKPNLQKWNGKKFKKPSKAT
jgi:hypothetical protein